MSANNNVYSNNNRYTISKLVSYILVGLISLVVVFFVTGIASGHDTDDSHAVGVVSTPKREGDALKAKITAPANHRVKEVRVAGIDKMSECNATDTDFAGDNLLDNVATKRTQEVTLDDNVTDDADDDALTDDHNYACLEVTYQSGSGDAVNVHDEVYLVTSKIDLENPTLESVNVKSGTYTTGDTLQVMLEFSEEVEFINNSGDKDKTVQGQITIDPDALPQLQIDVEGDGSGGAGVGTADEYLFFNLKDAKEVTKDGDVAISSKVFTFEEEVEYRQGYVEFDETVRSTHGFIVRWVAAGGNRQYVVKDKSGNSWDADLSDNYDFPGANIENFDVTIDNTPKVMLSFVDTDTLEVKITPDMYATFGATALDDPTVTGVQYVMLDENPGSDTCYEAKGDGDVSSLGSDSRIDDLEVGNWYCVYGQLHGRAWHDSDSKANVDEDTHYYISSAWVKYVEDSAGPTMTLKVSGSTLMITAEDTAGVKSVDWKFASSQNDQCSLKENYNNKNNDAEVSITATSAEHGRWICIKATDNRGNERSQIAQLNYVTPTTPPVTTPTTPPTTPTDDDKDVTQPEDIDSETEEDTTEATEVVVPDNWSELELAEQLSLNPYQCQPNDAGVILFSGTDATCLPGSPSALGDDVTVVDGSEAEDTTASETETPTEEPAPTTGSAQVGIRYNQTANSFEVSGSQADGSDLTDFSYAVSTDNNCQSATGYATVSSGSISLTDLDSDSYVCVRAMDASNNEYVYNSRQVGVTTEETPTTPVEETTEEDEEEGSAVVWIALGVVVVVLLIIVVVAASNKKNDQI